MRESHVNKHVVMVTNSLCEEVEVVHGFHIARQRERIYVVKEIKPEWVTTVLVSITSLSPQLSDLTVTRTHSLTVCLCNSAIYTKTRTHHLSPQLSNLTERHGHIFSQLYLQHANHKPYSLWHHDNL